MEAVAGPSNLCGDVITGRLAHPSHGGRTIARQRDLGVGAFAIRALFDSIPPGKHVELLCLDQKEFWPADQLSGKSPFDLEFLEKKTLATVPCPKN
jgi:hypothetical protein